ncbi:MAG: replicative DNA helicase [Desulfovibrionaceae bacterium]
MQLKRTLPTKKNIKKEYYNKKGAESHNTTNENQGQIPPHNLLAERSVLGGIFLRNEICSDIMEMLSPDSFYTPQHKIIFSSCYELYSYSKAIDLVTVAEFLQSRGELDLVGGAAYLAELASGVISAIHTLEYAKIVRDKFLQRQLISSCLEIIEEAYIVPQEEVKTLLDEAEQKIFSLSESTLQANFLTPKQLVEDVFTMLEDRYKNGSVITGVSTGYTKLDEVTAGMQKSELTIIAARPSMGKTAFALNIAMRSATNNVGSIIFSLEMTARDLTQRMLSIWGKVNLSKMRRGQLEASDWKKLSEAGEAISKLPIIIDDTPRGLTTLELRARARRLKSQYGIGLIIVDYLQLMRSSRKCDSREQEVADISRSLKAVAKELDIPVIALAQLNRGVEQRTDKKPLLSDLRESGAIEQDADVIMFIHREDVYRKNEEHPKKGIADIVIGKQRNGPIGEVQLRYFSEYTCFESTETRYST